MSNSQLLQRQLTGGGSGGGGGIIPPVLGSPFQVLRVNAAGTALEYAFLTNASIATGAAIAVNKLATGGVNTVLWSDGATNSFTNAPIVSQLQATTSLQKGPNAGSGAGSAAAAGALRLPGNLLGIIGWRNTADTADIASIATTATNVLQFAAPAGLLFANGASFSSSIGASGAISSGGIVTGTNFVNNGPLFTFASLAVNPTISQATDATPSATGDPFTTSAQDVSGNTNTVGGRRFDRAGNATGTGGTHTGGAYDTAAGDATGAAGTRTGGDWTARPGAGGTANGSLRLRNAAAVDRIVINSTGIGFFGSAPVAQPSVTGSRASGAALVSLLAALTAVGGLGLIVDNTIP